MECCISSTASTVIKMGCCSPPTSAAVTVAEPQWSLQWTPFWPEKHCRTLMNGLMCSLYLSNNLFSMHIVHLYSRNILSSSVVCCGPCCQMVGQTYYPTWCWTCANSANPQIEYHSLSSTMQWQGRVLQSYFKGDVEEACGGFWSTIRSLLSRTFVGLF